MTRSLSMGLATGMVLLLALGMARAQSGPEIPPALDAWRGFALHGAAQRLCPPDGNETKTRVCVFPASLAVNLDASGAEFTLRARLFDTAAVGLPGGEGVWLSGVSAAGRPVPVVAGLSGPEVWLEPGEYVLTGRLGWKTAPDRLRLPPDTGLVTLSRGGANLPVRVSPSGELVLSPGEAAKPVENTVNVKVFRLLADGVPVTVTTLARLEVSGLARSISLAGAVPPGAEALAVRAPVPAGLGPEGSIVLDAGPGRYEVEVVARYPGKIDTLPPAVTPYGREVWSFQADGALRETRLEGPAGLDPKTADVPLRWQALPAYAVAAGTVVDIRELGRGLPPGRDNLTLAREMWLDMSGQGMSVRDRIAGENRSAWTLSMLAPGELGRVSIDGRDQPVVLTGQDGLRGVELRSSRLEVAAESRYPDARAAFAAGGFDREFSRITATLNLAPGWALLAASGPDEVRGGLLSPWTLLDVFLALLLAVAAFSLRGPAAGLVMGLFLLLSWHEPGAPTGEWLGVLAGLALLRLVGEGGKLSGHAAFRRFAGLVYGLSLIGLVVVSIPFIAGQLRAAVAPQIAPPVTAVPPAAFRATLEDAAEAPPAPAARPKEKARAGANVKATPMLAQAPGAPAASDELEFDPDALVQTGPAMPTWHFAGVSLVWKGPVAVGQPVRLLLVPPVASRLLDLARAVLWGLALFLLCDRAVLRRLRLPVGAVGVVPLLLAWLAGSAMAGDFPDRPLLEALRDRLTEPARCFPHCLGSPGLEVRLEGGKLTITSEIDAAARTTAPLPAVSENWRPESVSLDGGPGPALTRAGGALKVLLEPGRHVIVLAGPAPGAVSFTLSPGLAPGLVRVTAPGYRIGGLDARGMLAGPLELTRAEAAASGSAGRSAASAGRRDIAPFFAVRRSLHFGLTWEVATEVVRRSPTDVAAVARLALLPGENPDTVEVTARNGLAEVAFPAGRDRVAWRSRLAPRESLALAAPAGGEAVETWELTAAPFYDVTYAGPPPVGLLTDGGAWRPTFRPWPGETLTVAVTRPKAAPGAFLTLDRAELSVRQGAALRESRLVLGFRAAKGLRHAVTLPAGASLTRLTVGGRETLPTGADGEIGFALPPGATEVTLDFREAVGASVVLDTPSVDLRLPAATAVTRLELPEGRWLLAVFADTFLGPAVLYWGFLAVVAAMGLGLSFAPESLLTRWQWLLYALGLSQATPWGAVLAAAWLVALGWRRRHWPQGAFAFDAAQVGLVLLCLAGFGALYDVLGQGLLGLPRMQVAGPGQTAGQLVWTWDQVAGVLPSARVVCAPMALFRALMLAWAAWLAFMLPRWLRLGFDSLTTGGGWRRLRLPALPRRRAEAPPAAPGKEAPRE